MRVDSFFGMRLKTATAVIGIVSAIGSILNIVFVSYALSR